MRRAIGGVRVSTDRQVKGYGIAEQERDLRSHCAARGYELVEIIRDEGASGTWKLRSGLLTMLERARAGEADVVVYPKIDRLGRDASLILQTLEYIRSQGIPVEYADHAIDVSTAAGRFHEVVMAGVAGLELELIKQRMLGGREAKARSGKPPLTLRGLGYRSVSVALSRAVPEYAGRDGEVEIIESEAAIVREMYARYASGEMTQRGLTRWLNERGVRTTRGGLFSQRTVGDILANPIYRGELRWPDYRVRNTELPDGSRKRVFTPVLPDEQYVYPVPVIVDPELWQRAQDRTAINLETRVGRPPDNVYLLTGLIFCDQCVSGRGLPRRCTGGSAGQPVRGVRLYTYYMCASRGRADIEWCGAKVRCRDLEAATYKAALAACEPGRMGGLARQRRLNQVESAGATQETLSTLRATLREVNQQEERLADLILANISPTIVAARVQEVQTRQNALRAEILRLEREVSDWVSPDAAAHRAEQQAAQWRAELLDAKDDPVRLRAVYEGFLRVYIRPGKPTGRFDVLI